MTKSAPIFYQYSNHNELTLSFSWSRPADLICRRVKWNNLDGRVLHILSCIILSSQRQALNIVWTVKYGLGLFSSNIVPRLWGTVKINYSPTSERSTSICNNITGQTKRYLKVDLSAFCLTPSSMQVVAAVWQCFSNFWSRRLNSGWSMIREKPVIHHIYNNCILISLWTVVSFYSEPNHL